MTITRGIRWQGTTGRVPRGLACDKTWKSRERPRCGPVFHSGHVCLAAGGLPYWSYATFANTPVLTLFSGIFFTSSVR